MEVERWRWRYSGYHKPAELDAFAARDARGEPYPLRRLQRGGAEALTALVHKLSVFFDSRACIEHSRMAMCGGVQRHTSYGRVARWCSRSTPRIQSFGKPIAAAQNSSLTMPSMRFAWLGSRLLGKNSFVDMSQFAASVRVLCDMVGSGIEQVDVRGVGKHGLPNGLASSGRDL